LEAVNNNFTIIPGATFLVTGGAGFIGSNLCEALLGLGHSVRCLDDLSTGFLANIKPFTENPDFTFIQGDIRDFDTCRSACENVDYVLHQAAWGSVPRSIEMPVLYEKINIAGTLNMLQASLEAGACRFVYASSSSVYGDDPRLPKTEGNEGQVLSPYALTKKVNEEYGKLYHSLYGLPTIGLRYFNVFGRRQNPEGAYAAVIPKFIDLILNNTPPVINGDGTQSRDFTYIDNVIQANLLACAAPEAANGRAFNIACGGRTTVLDMLNIMKSALGSNIKPIFKESRKGDVKHSHADITAAREFLGYSPLYGFEEGVGRAVGWYCESLKKTIKRSTRK
jgi:UDP-N-acetylglucosamine 4-epimerase